MPVIGNDGVDCSIQSGGTSFIKWLAGFGRISQIALLTRLLTIFCNVKNAKGERLQPLTLSLGKEPTGAVPMPTSEHTKSSSRWW